MKRSYLLFCIALFAASVLHAETTYITDVSVISMHSDTVLEHQTVVVEGGKITAVAPTVSIRAANGLSIDGTGKFLIPALAEMHAHVPGGSSGAQYVQDLLNLYLANGITTIRGMLGQPSHIQLRQQLANHEITGPRLITSGPSFNGNSVSSPDQAAKMARTQHAAGYDFLKLHPGLKRDEYIKFVETAKSLDIPFAGHVSVHVGIPLTLESGQATIDHLDGYSEGFEYGYDEQQLEGWAIATRKAGVWNVPTQSLYENRYSGRSVEDLMARPGMAFVRRATANSWKNRVVSAAADISTSEAENYLGGRRLLIKLLQEHGAGLLLGSDAPQVMNVPGFAIHEALQYLVNAGLTPFESLSTGNVNVAKFFGESDRGYIEPGMLADLVLLNGNPLKNIQNSREIEGVMRDGKWFDRNWLDNTLDGIRDRKI